MNTGSTRCSTSGCAASGAWSSTWIRAALVEASRLSRPPVAGVRRSTGGSSVALTIWSSRRRDGLPQVNPGTIVLLLVAAIAAAWAAGLIRPHYEDARLTLRAFRAGRVLASFDFRDTRRPLAADSLATSQFARQRCGPPHVDAGATRSNQPVAPDCLAADVRPGRVVGQLVDLSPAQWSGGPLAHGHAPGGGDHQ